MSETRPKVSRRSAIASIFSAFLAPEAFARKPKQTSVMGFEKKEVSPAEFFEAELLSIKESLNDPNEQLRILKKIHQGLFSSGKQKEFINETHSLLRPHLHPHLMQIFGLYQFQSEGFAKNINLPENSEKFLNLSLRIFQLLSGPNPSTNILNIAQESCLLAENILELNPDFSLPVPNGNLLLTIKSTKEIIHRCKTELEKKRIINPNSTIAFAGGLYRHGVNQYLPPRLLEALRKIAPNLVHIEPTTNNPDTIRETLLSSIGIANPGFTLMLSTHTVYDQATKEWGLLLTDKSVFLGLTPSEQRKHILTNKELVQKLSQRGDTISPNIVLSACNSAWAKDLYQISNQHAMPKPNIVAESIEGTNAIVQNQGRFVNQMHSFFTETLLEHNTFGSFNTDQNIEKMDPYSRPVIYCSSLVGNKNYRMRIM